MSTVVLGEKFLTMLDKYQESAMRTRRKDLKLDLQKLEACMGLCGELSEIGELLYPELRFKSSLNKSKELVLELGDLLWYTAYYTACYGSRLSTVYMDTRNYNFIPKTKIPVYEFEKSSSDEIYKMLSILIGEVTDLQKKSLFHKHVINADFVLNRVGFILIGIKNIGAKHNFTLKEIMDLNTVKRYARYPNGFTSKDSINRKEYK